MLITKKHFITGVVNTLDLPVTKEQLKLYADGALVQDAFPHLDADQREFIITGTMPGDFEKMCELFE